jgi:23S rRNA (guanosine2251-2'-O)-methyltransferase
LRIACLHDKTAPLYGLKGHHLARKDHRQGRRDRGYRGQASDRPETRDQARANRRGGRREERGDPDLVRLWGFHPVREALRSKHREVIRLWATPEAAARLTGEVEARGIEIRPTTPEELAQRLPQDAVHQGLLLEARPLPSINVADLPATGLLLVLDQVTDPHNVGAIVRTAAAFGVDAIVTTERHSPALTGVLAKSASGGLEHVPICVVVNLARALETLGDMGYLRVGLDSDGPAALEDTVISKPLALVLGAEGKGLRRLSRENCDVLARLDMPGAIRSLNVSNACAVALTIAKIKLS